jgi:iron(III) transport system permease protein
VRLGASTALLVPVLAAGLALVVVPLTAMLRTVLTGGGDGPAVALARPGLTIAVLHTLGLALAVVVLAVPLGALLALVLRTGDLPCAVLLRAGVLLPVLVPDFVLAYSWGRAYGPAGFTDDALHVSWPGLEGPAGVVVVVAVNVVPLCYLVLAAGLAARAEPDQERAARVSGADQLTVLRTVTLPALAPALAAAAVLVFVLALGAFAIPEVLGSPAGFGTVTTRIYADLSRSSDPAAFVEAMVLALLLVVVAFAVVAPADSLVTPRLRVTRTAVTEPARIVAGPRTPARWAAVAAIGAYLALTVAVPLLALVTTALTRAVGLPPVPANWTTANLRAVLTLRTAEAFGRSLLLAALAAVLLIGLGGAVAALERLRAGRLLATAVTLTFVLPGSTLAVALLVGYGRWLGGSLLLILLAYLAKLWAFAHRPIAGALDRLPPEELAAARVSGASLPTAVIGVVLRPLSPAILVAALVCFLTALHEVTMSSLLYGPGSETLAVVVLNSEELGQVGLTASLSLLLTAVVVLPGMGCWLVVRRLDRHRP